MASACWRAREEPPDAARIEESWAAIEGLLILNTCAPTGLVDVNGICSMPPPSPPSCAADVIDMACCC
uniref:Uncharacterized protein n=1 Tax=Pristionchus pacificus TaxID=54126 RepID=A0A2A6BU81_PRIPA|eukprot:PDM69311.1 hypothetical protein PRIPAC_47613 [Pristionchus pacificus]